MVTRILPVTTLILFLAAAGSSFAFDFGGTLENDTGIQNSITDTSVVLAQQDTATAWFRAPVGSAALFYFEGEYQFTPVRPYLFDLDRAYFEATATSIPNGPSKFTFDLGRIRFTDMTGEVLDTKADGLSLAFSYPRAQITAKIGYTGFLLEPTSPVVMSLVDATNAASTATFFGSPRIVGDFELSLPDLFARQTLGLGVLFQQDLHPASGLVAAGTQTRSSIAGGALNTQYFGLEFGGQLVSTLYYGIGGYLNTGSVLSYVSDTSSPTGFSYEYAPVVGYYGGLHLTYFLPELFQSRIELRAAYSSGDSDATAYYGGNSAGNSTTFIPITQSQFATIFSPQLGNSANAELNFSIMPLSGVGIQALKTLRTEAKAITFFRTAFNSATGVGAPISSSGLDPGSKAAYLGTEIDGSIVAQPLSDLSVALTGGGFFPNVDSAGQSNGAFPSGTQPAYQVQLNVNLTF